MLWRARIICKEYNEELPPPLSPELLRRLERLTHASMVAWRRDGREDGFRVRIYWLAVATRVATLCESGEWGEVQADCHWMTELKKTGAKEVAIRELERELPHDIPEGWLGLTSAATYDVQGQMLLELDRPQDAVALAREVGGQIQAKLLGDGTTVFSCRLLLGLMNTLEVSRTHCDYLQYQQNQGSM